MNMMKTTMNRNFDKNLFLITLILLIPSFYGCLIKINSKVDQSSIIDSLSINHPFYKDRRILTRELPVLVIDTSFYPHFDSIIDQELQCSYYNKLWSGFSFYSQKDVIGYQIDINSANIFTYNYLNSLGIFYYRKHRFICEGVLNKEILSKSELKEQIQYFEFDEMKNSANYNDEFSSWYFYIRNHKILLKGHHVCKSN
jgi:hypothetical protein